MIDDKLTMAKNGFFSEPGTNSGAPSMKLRVIDDMANKGFSSEPGTNCGAPSMKLRPTAGGPRPTTTISPEAWEKADVVGLNTIGR